MVIVLVRATRIVTVAILILVCLSVGEHDLFISFYFFFLFRSYFYTLPHVFACKHIQATTHTHRSFQDVAMLFCVYNNGLSLFTAAAFPPLICVSCVLETQIKSVNGTDIEI